MPIIILKSSTFDLHISNWCSKIIVASSSPDVSSSFSSHCGTQQESVISCEIFFCIIFVALEIAPKYRIVYRIVLQDGENTKGSQKILYFLREICRIFWGHFLRASLDMYTFRYSVL